MLSNKLNTLHIVAFTHRNLAVNEIGDLHIDPIDQYARLAFVKTQLDLGELMFLSTCNRVEFTLTTDKDVNLYFLKEFSEMLYPEFNSEQRIRFSDSADIFKGIDAVEHLLSVASSVDSMVVGEREIITQVRKAFDLCKEAGFTGDLIRILMRHTIETAKRVYTETSIARKPVSVVSLAYHRLRDLNVPLDSRILIIGAGVTNTNMSRFLKKHGFTRFAVFNRTFSKAEKLAKDLHGKAFELSDLETYTGGFDVIITCTGSAFHLITPAIYSSLLVGETDRKVVIDLAIPQDLDPAIKEGYKVTHIAIDLLQEISNKNLKARSLEIQHVEEIIAEAVFEFEQIYKMREVEIAMRDVPQKVKEIKTTAYNEVFKTDIDTLDQHSREVLDKMVDYLEKKYMSVPMLMAKEILLKKQV